MTKREAGVPGSWRQVLTGTLLAVLFAGSAMAKAGQPPTIRLEVGKTYTYQLQASIEQTQSVMGTNVLVKQNTRKVTDYKALRTRQGGGYVLAVTLRKLVADSENSMQGKEDYNSEDAADKPYDAVRLDAWMIDRTYEVELDAQGKAVKVVGWEALRKEMEEKVSFKGEQSQLMKAALINAYTEEKVLEQVTAIFGATPAEALTANNSWKVKHKKGKHLGEENYKISEVTEAQITVVADWAKVPNPKAEAERLPNGILNEDKTSGTQHTELRIQPGTYLLLGRSITQNMTGIQQMSGGPLGNSPIPVDTKSELKTSIQLL